MPFAAIWMDLEIITRSEVRQRKTNCICSSSMAHMWNLKKKHMNELTYKTETDSHRLKSRSLWFQGRGEGGKR